MVAILNGIVSFFSDIGQAIIALKDLIVNFFAFIKDSLYLIPQPFCSVLQIAITIIIIIFVVKIIGGLT